MKDKITRRTFLSRQFVGVLSALAVVGRQEQVTILPPPSPEFRSMSDLDAYLRERGWQPE